MLTITRALLGDTALKQQRLNTIMGKAQDICADSGGRLTEKRKRILELLLVSTTPMSAYEAVSYTHLTLPTICSV